MVYVISLATTESPALKNHLNKLCVRQVHLRQLQANDIHHLPLLNQQIPNHINHLNQLQGQQDQVQN